MKKGCKPHYTNKKGVTKAYDSMEEAVSAARADYGTQLEAKASEYYREHRANTTTEEGSQEDFEAFTSHLEEKAITDKDIFGEKKTEPTAEEDFQIEDELTEEEIRRILGDSDSLDFNTPASEMEIRQSLNNRDDAMPWAMNAATKKMYTEGIGDFLVIDKDEIYNAHKQSIIVASIFEAAITAMEGGANALQAMNIAKLSFQERRAMYTKFSNPALFDRLPANSKKIAAIESVDDADELANEYNKILRNWNQFQTHTKQSMKAVLGITESMNDSGEVKVDSAEDSLDGYEQLDSILERVSFDDTANFGIDHKDTASARLKAFLALQRAPEKSFLNLNTFIPFDTVYDELQMLLAGTEPNYEAMVKRLTIHAAKRPYMRRLLDTLDGKSEQTKKDFVVAFAKQHQAHVLTDFKIEETGGIKHAQFRTMASNRNDVAKTIQQKWIENQKRSEMVTNKKGELMINPVIAAQFAAEVDRLAALTDIPLTDVKALLELTGIEVSLDALDYFSKESLKLTQKTFNAQFKKGGAFKYLADAFVEGKEDVASEDALLDLNNPLTGNEATSMNTLAQIEAEFTETIFSNSWRNVEGKTIYSYGLNTNLSHTMRELVAENGNNKTTRDLSEISFQKKSDWLRRIKEEVEFRNVFEVYYLDGFKKQRSSKKGLTRGKQSRREMELQMMAMFQNQGRGMADFIYPTISDKSTTPVIRALKHNSQIRIEADGSMIISKNVTTGENSMKTLLDIVFSEIDRIENYTLPEDGEAYSAYDVKYNEETSEWEGGAINFFMFPSITDVVKVLFNEDTKKFEVVPVVKGADLRKEMSKHIRNEVKQLALDKVEKWKELGIVTDKGTMLDSSYLNGTARPDVANKQNFEHLARYAALDQEINYIIANANVMQLISGDPATHYKKNVETTLGEYTKRLAKDIAPGMDGAFESPTYTMAFLDDLVVKSEHLEEYRVALGLKAGDYNPYSDIEVTDAQEYTTLEEHISVMNAYGKMNDDVYNSISKKIRESKESGKDVKLSESEMKIILQPVKPVQAYTDINSGRDVAMPVYIKSFSFPLIPELTKGLALDNMRKEMEKQGIDRAAYKSAAKLGSKKLSKIWEKDGSTPKNFSLEGKKVVLQRKGFRIQQEKPYKEGKTAVLTVSQMNKLLFEGIMELPGLDGGKSMKELRQRKENIRKMFFDQGMERLTQTQELTHL
jgi:hypothetical protein